MIVDVALREPNAVSFHARNRGLSKHLRRSLPTATSHKGLFLIERDFWRVKEALAACESAKFHPYGTAEFAAWYQKKLEVENLALLATRQRAARAGLFDYQREGCEWLQKHRRALLADDPGVGKSAQTLIALEAGSPVLVVCPASAKDVWKREAQKWRDEFYVTILHGRQSRMRWPKLGEIVVCNYDILPPAEYTVTGTPLSFALKPCAIAARAGLYSSRFPSREDAKKRLHAQYELEVDEARREEMTFRFWMKKQKMQVHAVPSTTSLLSPPERGTALVLDEAHAVKDRRSHRRDASFALARQIEERQGSAWALTASPMPNSPLELYALLEVIGAEKDVFGPKPFRQFLKDFHAERKFFGGFTFGKPASAFHIRKKNAILRREKRTVLPNLPTFVRQDITVAIPQSLQNDCDVVYEALRALGLEFSFKQALLELEKDKVLFERFSKARSALALAKLPALLELLEPLELAKEPVVVFSAHAKPLEAFAIRDGWKLFRGDVSDEDRASNVRLFQAGALKGLALTIQAGGTAITLTRGAHVFFLDQTFNPEMNRQAVDRLVRIGQTRGVVVTVLEADHILDRQLTKLCQAKSDMFAAAMAPEDRESAP